MIVTVTNPRQSDAAIDATRRLVREVAAAYCEQVGDRGPVR